jgi:hypothetical protein
MIQSGFSVPPIKAFSEEPETKIRGRFSSNRSPMSTSYFSNLERKALSPATLPPSMNVVIGPPPHTVNA